MRNQRALNNQTHLQKSKKVHSEFAHCIASRNVYQAAIAESSDENKKWKILKQFNGKSLKNIVNIIIGIVLHCGDIIVRILCTQELSQFLE